MICRDPVIVNWAVNHPDVRPFVGPGGELDLSEAVSRPENWFLMGEFGGFGLIWSAPGVHEVHTFITKAGRGEKARIMAQAVIDYAAMQGDNMLWTKIPGDQPNVEAFAVGMGMAPCGFAVETFGKSYAVYKMELASCQ